MKLSVFLELVEFKAKTASVLPFLIGLCFSIFHYQSVHIGYVSLFFVAMLLFNMAVDILDNYNDYRHAIAGHDYKEKTNIIGREHLSLRTVWSLMVGMIIISAGMGIWLSTQVGAPILWLGIYCYLVGIFYSSGPRPLSSLPLGEFFSGFTMGFMISLICVYLNTFQFFDWSLESILEVFLISLPNTLWIANLMLANNMCDLKEDEQNERYTLVHYLGVERSKLLFIGLTFLPFVAICLAVWFKLAPITNLLTLLILPVIVKQARAFLKKQDKKETFPCAVKILAIGALTSVLTYGLGLLFMS